MEPSIIRCCNDKKAVLHRHLPPPHTPPEQFYQPGGCEEAGWPDVTHIVASAFEGPGSSLGPGMGWLNRFSVFTAGLLPSAHFNLSNNKRWTEDLEFSKQWMNFLSNGWIELQVAQYLFIGVLFRGVSFEKWQVARFLSAFTLYVSQGN